MQRSQADATLTPVNEILRHGITVFPAKTNDFNSRRAAVESLLTRLTVGGKPALQVDKNNCKRLIKGFISGYYYKRRAGYNDLYRDTPEKNKYSHVHDALQYGALETTIDHIREGERKMYAASSQYSDHQFFMDSRDTVWEVFQ
jgi:hypothetical protein